MPSLYETIYIILVFLGYTIGFITLGYTVTKILRKKEVYELIQDILNL